MANPVVNAAIRRLIQAGFPEGTARKIATGELSMDPAAKAARMSEQGYFDIYHGGAGDISAFDPATFGGSTTGAKSAQMATWGVDDPRVAETYARYAGEDVPVQRLIAEADAAGRRGDFDLQERLYLQAEALEQSGELVGGGGQNVMPLMARGNYLDKDAKGGTLSDLDEGQIAQWVQEAKDKGYDGVRIRDFSDNADYGVYLPATHYGIIDPTKIRSRFAAFDPDELDNPNILAGLGAAGVGAGLMAPEEAEAAGFGKIANRLVRSTSDASNIFGEGAEEITLSDPVSGGRIKLLSRPGEPNSVLSLYVDEEFRGQGVGKALQDAALTEGPLMGQVSSKAAAVNAYRAGRRPADNPNASLEEVFAAIDEDSSVNMVTSDLRPSGKGAIGAGAVGAGLMAPDRAEASVASPLDRQDDVPDYMRRLDGTVKSERGFLGPIRNNVSGKTMTEVSIGQPGSEEGFYPLLVPTLTPEEVETIANMDLERERPPFSIIEKARAHALERIDRGLSPFYQDGEEGGAVRSPLERPEAAERRANARAVAVASDTLERLRRERGPRMAPLRSNFGTALGDYMTEDRLGEMDAVQRALQNLGALQGIGEYIRTTSEGQRTTTMQNINAALDIVPL